MTTAFLVLGLLFPRITLLWCYFVAGIPTNDTPFALDVMASVFAPRLLIAWWAYHTPGVHPLWTVLYVVVWAAVVLGQRSSASTQSDRGRS